MIRLPVLKEEFIQARLDAVALGKLNRSILAGEGNLAGFLGELAVHRYFKYLGSKRSNTFHHDLRIGKHRFDVKTKRRTVEPLPNYVGTVPAYSKQDCHAYIFTSVHFQGDIPVSITLCGWMESKSFRREATPIKKGDRCAENNWICSMDCFDLEYSKMRPIIELETDLIFR
jgi:hypothetical protein